MLPPKEGGELGTRRRTTDGQDEAAAPHWCEVPKGGRFTLAPDALPQPPPPERTPSAGPSVLGTGRQGDNSCGRG